MPERELLSRWLDEGVAKKEIARRLGRNIKTIRREIKRNSTRIAVGKNDWEIIYEPLHAHAVAMDRKQKAFSAKYPLKNPDVYSYVLKHLREGWSPEEISGRLREQDHRGDPHWQICMETIYQFIYKKKTDQTKQKAITITDHNQPLWEYLRRKQVRTKEKRRKKSATCPDTGSGINTRKT